MKPSNLLKRTIPLIVATALGLSASFTASAETPKPKKPVAITAVGQSILDAKIADGVSLDDAVDSMKLRANQINFKLVAELPLSKQVEVMTGEPQRRMTIFQFCDAMTAKEMVDYNQAFAAFLPCRMAVLEDANGEGHILMLNLGPLIQSSNMPPALRAKAAAIQSALLEIMMAGANGDL